MHPEETPAPSPRPTPLVVDLDGTLLHSDLLAECAIAYLRQHPWGVFKLVLWLLRGKAYLKGRLAQAVTLDIAHLPYNRTLLHTLREECARGRPLWLATGAHQHPAEAIARHLGLFRGVLATRENDNLSGPRKRDVLVEHFGEGGFDYAGNDTADLAVWPAARRAWVVNPTAGAAARAGALPHLDTYLDDRAPYTQRLRQTLRVYQWAKNLLLLVPLLASHRILEPALAFNAGLAFITFSLCASAVYILNDLLDLDDDRRRPAKCERPLAAGTFPVRHALVLAPGLVLAAFGLSLWLLPPLFVAALAGYLALTTLYSFWLKRLVMVDVLALATLYTQRIIAGALACGLALTFWILAFSMFIFLSLAMVKRYTELLERTAAPDPGASNSRRGYYDHDLPLIASLGGASGYLSVLVLALYIQDPAAQTLYDRPYIIWLACPIILFWISRTWLLAHRGRMPRDPVLFALTDRVSLLTGVVFMAVFIAAL